MLQFNDLSLRRGQRLLFENAGFQVFPGQKVGITGANGTGKSSLFALILGQLHADSGDCLYPKDWVVAHVAQEMPTKNCAAIDYVLDGDAELRRIEAALALAEADNDGLLLATLYGKLDNIGGYSARSRAGQLMNGLGFGAGDEDRLVEEFSGGWRMRLNLARALMCRSDLLLLDEPTNHLDLEMRQALIRALVEFGGAMVLISHDRHLLRTVCDELIVVHDGLVERFDDSIDDYPAWLAERQSTDLDGDRDKSRETSPANRKRQRQEEAQRRLALKPLTDQIRRIENTLSSDRSRLQRVEESLADAGLYSDPDRRTEMEDLSRARAELQSAIDALEAQWLEASEALERAAGTAAPG